VEKAGDTGGRPWLLYSSKSSSGAKLSTAGTRWAGFTLEVHEAPLQGDVTGHLSIPAGSGSCLVLINDGRAEVEYCSQGRRQRTHVRPGYSSLTSDELVLDRIRWTGRAEYTIVSLPPGTLVAGNDQGPSGRASDASQPALHNEASDPQVTALLGCMRREIECGCPGGRLFGESISLALATHLSRRYQRAARPPAALPQLTERQCGRIDDYLRAHLDQEVSVFTLAALAGLSPSYFSTQFRHSFGMTPHRYLTQRRIEEAKRLLRQTGMPLSDIALQVGYSDQSHFTHAFRRCEGSTPAAWRHARRGGAAPE
jgi:AraC family transcriptional regulator